MRRSQRFLIVRYRIQSSANNLISERMSLAMSLMYSKNNKGPRTVPCGTPDETVRQDDWVPFSVTRWRRDERKDSTHRKVPPHMPYQWSFTKRRLWGTESKAFEKSKTAMSVLVPESRLLAQSSIAKTSYVSQEWPALKPCWRGDKILFDSRNRLILEWMICSKTLLQMHVNDTGL